MADDNHECPLCMEAFEIDDLHFYPCTCGYQICRFCWHRIRTDGNGLCPACRKTYTEDPAMYRALTHDEIQKVKKERKQKDAQQKQKISDNRQHLSNIRVIQRHLVFVVGLSNKMADAEVLRRPEYFGSYGKIVKIVINPNTNYAGPQGPSASAYITYTKEDDALKAILAINDMQPPLKIRASLGTTKYCTHYLRNQVCPKTDCMYLHDVGDPSASFTKEDMQAGKHQMFEKNLLDNFVSRQAQFESEESYEELDQSSEQLDSRSHDSRSQDSRSHDSRSHDSRSHDSRSHDDWGSEEADDIDIKTPPSKTSWGTPKEEKSLNYSEEECTGDYPVLEARKPSPKEEVEKPPVVVVPVTTLQSETSRPVSAPIATPIVKPKPISPPIEPVAKPRNTQPDTPTKMQKEANTGRNSGFGWSTSFDSPPDVDPSSLLSGSSNITNNNFLWPSTSDLGLSDLKINSSDDDLGFDPFNESKTGLEDLMASEKRAANQPPSAPQQTSFNWDSLWPSNYGSNQNPLSLMNSYSLFGASQPMGGGNRHHMSQFRPPSTNQYPSSLMGPSSHHPMMPPPPNNNNQFRFSAPHQSQQQRFPMQGLPSNGNPLQRQPQLTQPFMNQYRFPQPPNQQPPPHLQGHTSQSSLPSASVAGGSISTDNKNWQDGLRALLPNINISFSNQQSDKKLSEKWSTADTPQPIVPKPIAEVVDKPSVNSPPPPPGFKGFSSLGLDPTKTPSWMTTTSTTVEKQAAASSQPAPPPGFSKPQQPTPKDLFPSHPTPPPSILCAPTPTPAIPQNISGSNISGSNISGPNIPGSNITVSNITGTNIVGPNIAVPNIAVPNITGPNITGSNITGPNITGQNIAVPNIAVPNIAVPNIAVPNIAVPNIAAPNIAGPNIAGPNIAGPNIAGPNIAGPNITAQNITGPNIPQFPNLPGPNDIRGPSIVAASNMSVTNIPIANIPTPNIPVRGIPAPSITTVRGVPVPNVPLRGVPVPPVQNIQPPIIPVTNIINDRPVESVPVAVISTSIAQEKHDDPSILWSKVLKDVPKEIETSEMAFPLPGETLMKGGSLLDQPPVVREPIALPSSSQLTSWNTIVSGNQAGKSSQTSQSKADEDNDTNNNNNNNSNNNNTQLAKVQQQQSLHQQLQQQTSLPTPLLGELPTKDPSETSLQKSPIFGTQQKLYVKQKPTATVKPLKPLDGFTTVQSVRQTSNNQPPLIQSLSNASTGSRVSELDDFSVDLTSANLSNVINNLTEYPLASATNVPAKTGAKKKKRKGKDQNEQVAEVTVGHVRTERLPVAIIDDERPKKTSGKTKKKAGTKSSPPPQRKSPPTVQIQQKPKEQQQTQPIRILKSDGNSGTTQLSPAQVAADSGNETRMVASNSQQQQQQHQQQQQQQQHQQQQQQQQQQQLTAEGGSESKKVANGNNQDREIVSRLTESTEKLLKNVLFETEAIRLNTEQISKDLKSALEKCKESSLSLSDLEKINVLLTPGKLPLVDLDDSDMVDTYDLERQVESAQREAKMLEARLNDVIRKNMASELETLKRNTSSPPSQ